MFKITLKQLLEATNGNASNGQGSLSRFYAAKKTGLAGYQTQDDPAACDKALKGFFTARLEIVKQYGTQDTDKEGKLLESWSIPDPEKQAEANREMEELLAQGVLLPGELIRPTDIRDDTLSTLDWPVLKPFVKAPK